MQIRFEDSPADDYERTPYLYSQNGFSELPPNVSVPGANSEIVLSEMNEPDKNRTGILQWILGIAGLTSKPAPVDPDDVPSPEKCYECGKFRKNILFYFSMLFVYSENSFLRNKIYYL